MILKKQEIHDLSPNSAPFLDLKRDSIKILSKFMQKDSIELDTLNTNIIKISRNKGYPEWETCSPASLRGHIVNAHLKAHILMTLGIPRYDIEVAALRGIQLDWVVQKAYEKLARPEAETKGEDTIERYKQMIVKTLLYIEKLGLATIDWKRVSMLYPKARKIRLDLPADGHDSHPKYNPPETRISFLSNLATTAKFMSGNVNARAGNFINPEKI